MLIHTCFTEIRISGDYSNLTVGSTTNITCDVPGLMSSVVSWTPPWSGATSTSHTLMLTSVDSTLDGVNFTCSVSSNQSYAPGEKMITVTVKGLICVCIMSYETSRKVMYYARCSYMEMTALN